jgi:hypothetical protein
MYIIRYEKFRIPRHSHITMVHKYDILCAIGSSYNSGTRHVDATTFLSLAIQEVEDVVEFVFTLCLSM